MSQIKRYRVRLETLSNVLDLLKVISTADKPIYITNANHTKVLGAHSIISDLAALDFDEIWVEAEEEEQSNDLYNLLKDVLI